MTSPSKHNKRLGSLWTILICCLIILLSYLLVTNKQRIIDQFVVWQYKSSTTIDTIINRTGLNDYGKFLFYASQPTLDGTQSFNTECTRIEDSTAIFGCYKDSRIYIYNITDEKLDGVREVTAAHETLHAAYARLSSSDKEAINTLVETEYKKLKTDNDFQKIIEYYDSAEPGQRDNELFAIIGTEISDIDSKLEKYYSRYFSDREKVITLNDKYSSVFEALEQKADTLSNELDSLYKTITAEKTQYEADVKTFNSDVSAFNSKTFYSYSEYNTELAELRSRETTLNNTKASINNEIVEYNNLLSEYNSIISQSKELYKSIDSSLAPASSVD